MPAFTLTDKSTIDREALERIAAVFRVFSEPTRLAILQFIKGKPRNVGEIVEALDTSQANVSKQLRIMFDADLLHREQRGNQVFYGVKDKMIFELCGLVCDKLNRCAQATASVHYEI